MTQTQVMVLARTGEVNPRFTIRAPLPGTVIEREVTLGELVSPDKEALLVLADTSTYWVLADVPEAQLAEIEIGAKATIELAAIKADPLNGVVSAIAPALDPETRSARVRIEVSNVGTVLRPGMFSRVAIETEAKDAPPVLAIPEEAVQTVEGEPAVFVPVEDEPNTFAKRPVRVGQPVGSMVPVLDGLKPDEQLVVSGSFILKAELGKSEAAHEH
jgi:cobalt-zinc-cadmium efflux system membrane fusion protein